jgi:broad specificity phosphatase PhoE
MERKITPESKDENETEIFFIRHSNAQYRADFEQVMSDEPNKAIDRKKQPSPDLSPEGVELAHTEAEKLYKQYPKGTRFTFLSSNLARANETARIYREEAIKAQMEVVDVSKEGEGVRTLETLSLREYSPLSLGVFDNMLTDEEIENFKLDKVDSEYKRQWFEARKYVAEQGFKGSWGETFQCYSKYVSENFPLLKISSKEDLFKKQFIPLTRLAHWALNRFKKENIKILCFGHEDYVSRLYELNSEAKGSEYKGIGYSKYFKVNLRGNELQITIP